MSKIDSLTHQVQDSAIKVEEAKAGRKIEDIGIRDPYWDAVKIHQSWYNKLKDAQAEVEK